MERLLLDPRVVARIAPSCGSAPVWTLCELGNAEWNREPAQIPVAIRRFRGLREPFALVRVDDLLRLLAAAAPTLPARALPGSHA